MDTNKKITDSKTQQTSMCISSGELPSITFYDLQNLPEDPALGAIRANLKRLAELEAQGGTTVVVDRFSNPTAPYLTTYNYKNLNFKCRSCNWSGYGFELEMGEVFDLLFEIECPACSAYIGAVPFPIVEP